MVHLLTLSWLCTGWNHCVVCSCSEWSCGCSGVVGCCKGSGQYSTEGEIYCLSVSKYINLDVYRMGGLHCTWPVRMVTVKLLGCCWWPGLTWTWRLMWVTLHGGVCVLCWFHGWVQRSIPIIYSFFGTSNHIEVNKGFDVPKEELDDRLNSSGRRF